MRLPEITNSLRFRVLRAKANFRHCDQTSNWTYSFWIKRSKLGARQDFFDASNDGALFEMWFDVDDSLRFGKSSSTSTSSAAKFRDPSAWYHVVCQNNGTDVIGFVNGTEVQRWAGSGGNIGINEATEHAIGLENFSSGDGLYTEGYMAAVYFIDGQVLEPTAFAAYNENDVWVPREVDLLLSAAIQRHGL